MSNKSNHKNHFAEKTKEIIEEGNKTAKKIPEVVGGTAVDAVKTTIEVEKGGLKVIKDTLMFPYKKRRSIKDFFLRSKRGVITGAADNDPSGIVTYTQTGAIAGFRLLWLCLIAVPILTVIEEMSARIGIVTKRGVNQVVIENYGRVWAYSVALIVLVCNTFTIGADIAAMADVAASLTSLPGFFYVILLGGIFFLLLWKKGYKAISSYLFVLTAFFILYIASALLLDVPWGNALRHTFMPSLDLSLSFIAVAFLGTTLSPYLIFWEANQEIEEKKKVEDLKKESIGQAVGMFFSQFIAFFIVVAAATVFAGNNHELSSAKEVAFALKPLGNSSFLLYSLGILGAGLLAIPVLSASTGYTIAETFGWSRSLDKKVSQARGFYVVMITSLFIGVLIALFRFNPVLMLLYSQVLNGLLMPVLIILLLKITNNPKIMGQYTNKFWTNFIGIIALVVTIGFDLMMIWDWIR